MFGYPRPGCRNCLPESATRLLIPFGRRNAVRLRAANQRCQNGVLHV